MNISRKLAPISIFIAMELLGTVGGANTFSSPVYADVEECDDIECLAEGFDDNIIDNMI